MSPACSSRAGSQTKPKGKRSGLTGRSAVSERLSMLLAQCLSPQLKMACCSSTSARPRCVWTSYGATPQTATTSIRQAPCASVATSAEVQVGQRWLGLRLQPVTLARPGSAHAATYPYSLALMFAPAVEVQQQHPKPAVLPHTHKRQLVQGGLPCMQLSCWVPTCVQ